MSEKYKIFEEDKANFLTLTVVGWCLMSNHLHMIVKAAGKQTLSEIIRDFKKFTSRTLVNDILEEPESRRDWMMNRFEYNARFLKRIEEYKFWQDGNHPEISESARVRDARQQIIRTS